MAAFPLFIDSLLPVSNYVCQIDDFGLVRSRLDADVVETCILILWLLTKEHIVVLWPELENDLLFDFLIKRQNQVSYSCLDKTSPFLKGVRITTEYFYF